MLIRRWAQLHWKVRSRSLSDSPDLYSELLRLPCSLHAFTGQVVFTSAAAAAPKACVGPVIQEYLSMRIICFFVLLCNSAALDVKLGSHRDVVEDAADFLLDARWQTQQMDDLSKEVGELAASVQAGGSTAK